jgi:hypothetical protein
MDFDDLTKVMAIRAADARGIILPFVLAHTATMIVLGFGGAGLENSGIQLALAAWAVLGSLWSVLWLDDCIQDLMAAGKDMPEEFKKSHMGQRLVDAPATAVRLVNVVIVGLIVAAELMAIY